MAPIAVSTIDLKSVVGNRVIKRRKPIDEQAVRHHRCRCCQFSLLIRERVALTPQVVNDSIAAAIEFRQVRDELRPGISLLEEELPVGSYQIAEARLWTMIVQEHSEQ